MTARLIIGLMALGVAGLMPRSVHAQEVLRWVTEFGVVGYDTGMSGCRAGGGIGGAIGKNVEALPGLGVTAGLTVAVPLACDAVDRLRYVGGRYLIERGTLQFELAPSVVASLNLGEALGVGMALPRIVAGSVLGKSDVIRAS
jgi:hypothetical protein